MIMVVINIISHTESNDYGRSQGLISGDCVGGAMATTISHGWKAAGQKLNPDH